MKILAIIPARAGSKGIPSSYLLDLDNNIINYHKGVLNFEKFVNFFNGEEI